uniref:BRCT domain-containing protein n=1 Tax=Rhizophora mucronata TaxID=61149 RepID=A0A2P2K6L1_RHIMU
MFIIIMNTSGIKFQAAKVHGDVIHYSWVWDCCSQKKLLPLQLKLVLHSFPLIYFFVSLFSF